MMQLNTKMETGYHFKNGASPKSQTSRGNLLLFGMALFAFCVFTNSAMGQTIFHIGHPNYNSDVTATLSGNTLTITGDGNMADFWSSSGDGITSTTGGEAPWWFDPDHRKAIKTVIIQGNVKNIGDRAFKDCENLEVVTIQSPVSRIGRQAFNNCTSLLSITIPNSVTEIEGQAFLDCSNLESITIENGDKELTFSHFSYTGNEYSKGEKYEWFDGCSNIKTLYLGRDLNVSSISPISYIRNTLQSLTIGSTVTVIRGHTFENCTNLQNVIIKENKDKSLVFGDGNSYGNTVFLGSSIGSLELGRNISYLSSPFSDNKFLTSVKVGNNVTTINFDCFYGCSGLITVEFGSGLTKIERRAFYGCENLTSKLNIPQGIESIEDYAFYNCKKTDELVIPSSVQSIRSYAFAGCTNLQNVIIKEKIKDTSLVFVDGNTVFLGSSIRSLELGRNISYLSSPFSDNKFLTSVKVGNNVTTINFDCFYGCSGLITVEFGSGLTKIERRAFYGCENLTSKLNIPQGVESIEDYAFYNCKKTDELVIPSSVQSIRSHAFAGCSNLQKVVIKESKDPKDSFVFLNDVFLGSSIGSLELGRNISSASPFRDNTLLTSLTIGNQVTSIPSSCFSGCNGLKEIHSQNPTPPSAPNNCFYNVYATCKLYVPIGAASSYNSTSQPEWKKFFDNGNGIEGTPGTTPTLTVSPTNFTFPAAGSTSLEINVTSNQSWTVSSSASWLTTSRTSGSSNNTFTMTAIANTSTTSRNATVTVTGGGITRAVAITQEGVDPVSLTVSPETYNFPATGGTSSAITVTSNQSWTVSSNVSWLTTSLTSGSNNNTFTMTTAANTSTSTRNATVTVVGGGITRTINVTQSPITQNLPCPIFDGLKAKYTRTESPVTLKFTGEGSTQIHTFRVNGTAATTFNPANYSVGSKVLIEVVSDLWTISTYITIE